MATFVKTLQILWSNTLSLVLLNLRSAPFGIHKLSPFEKVAGWPTHLALVPFDLQLVKGDVLQCFKGLIASTQINRVLIEHSKFLGDDVKPNTL